MRIIKARHIIVFVVAVLSLSLIGGCAHMEKAPKDRPGYLYYHKPLPEAARALDDARAKGKDKECPAEYAAAKDLVDKAYEKYLACYDREAMDMAKDAINKINALCPPKAVEAVPAATISAPGAVPAPKVTFKADPSEIIRSQCSTLMWTSEHAKALSIDQGVGKVDAAGSKSVCPQDPTTYTLTASGDGGTATAQAAVNVITVALEDVHFDYDKATLTTEGKAILERNLSALKERPGVKVQIEGHACAHGTEKYNMALSERRALAVKEFLVKGGVDAARMTTISYGETRLLMPEKPTAKNKNSKEAKANRRVHFEVIVK